MPSPEVLPPLQHRFPVVILGGGNVTAVNFG
jgi:hypothetical protein